MEEELLAQNLEEECISDTEIPEERPEELYSDGGLNLFSNQGHNGTVDEETIWEAGDDIS